MPKTASITERLAALGSEKWAVHFDARKRKALGEHIIELTIGEPDIPTPTHLLDVASDAMHAGRTRYSGGKGELTLREALAQKYAKRSGRAIHADQVLAFPGTQAALTICTLALVEKGDDVLVPDPYYATYEAVVGASGAGFFPVPTSPQNGFHLTADQLESCVTPSSKVLLLNSPHNPTGAVLNRDEILAIGEVCRKHDLWIVSDEVYESLIYESTFSSAFDEISLADRTIVTSSISKSHAAPGFRSGWCVGPEKFIAKAQPVSEAILFGNQPFIADMTTHALLHPDDTAQRMSMAYRRRIQLIMEIFADSNTLKPIKPHAGMFMLLDVSGSGMDGGEFAKKLLDQESVATMPGDAFGAQAKDFIRLSLTVDDELLAEGARRMLNLN